MAALLHAFRGSHVRLWLAAVLAVAVVGTAGYVVLGWPVGDAVYMTGITLTTVGPVRGGQRTTGGEAHD